MPQLGLPLFVRLLCLAACFPPAFRCRPVQQHASDGALTPFADGAGPGASGAGGRNLLPKRGVGSHLSPPQIRALRGLGWWYTWGPATGDGNITAAAAAAGMKFVPMQWGKYGVEALADLVQPGSHVLLGFNEPNIHGQALWPQVQAVADELGLRLGSPSASPCGLNCVTPDPFKWLDQFFAACQGCRVDFMATHYYACRPDWLQSYLRQFRRYARPIWLTEFACPNPHGPDSVSWQYMARVLPQLDADPWVERYAWFATHTSGWLGTSNSLLNASSDTLTPLGRLYLSPPRPVPPRPVPPPTNPGAAEGRAQHDAAIEGSSSSGSSRAASVPASVSSTGGGGVKPADADVGADLAAEVPSGTSWSTLCAACIRHLEVSHLASLPPRQQRYCSLSCGFWARRPEPEARLAGGASDLADLAMAA